MAAASRFLAVWTNWKKARYSGGLSWLMPRCWRSHEPPIYALFLGSKIEKTPKSGFLKYEGIVELEAS